MSRQADPSNLEHPRQRRERDTVHKMIEIYCRAHHHPPDGGLCSDCQALADYTVERLVRCPYGWRKPTCAKCPIHCYTPVRREEIRTVMRYAGPRMLFHHPWLTVLHLADGLRKPQTKNRE